MKVKVYLHETLNEDNDSLCLYSKEFGWLEYFDKDDAYSPFVYKSKLDMIKNSYVPEEKALESFYKWGKITYLGEL